MEELALGYTNIVFSGIRDRKPLSDITLTAALKRMGRTDITVHGFRSTFCDRAAEATLYSREIAEMALAHKVSYQVEVPYRHVEMFKKRRKMVPD